MIEPDLHTRRPSRRVASITSSCLSIAWYPLVSSGALVTGFAHVLFSPRAQGRQDPAPARPGVHAARVGHHRRIQRERAHRGDHSGPSRHRLPQFRDRRDRRRQHRLHHATRVALRARRPRAPRAQDDERRQGDGAQRRAALRQRRDFPGHRRRRDSRSADSERGGAALQIAARGRGHGQSARHTTATRSCASCRRSSSPPSSACSGARSACGDAFSP